MRRLLAFLAACLCAGCATSYLPPYNHAETLAVAGYDLSQVPDDRWAFCGVRVIVGGLLVDVAVALPDGESHADVEKEAAESGRRFVASMVHPRNSLTGQEFLAIRAGDTLIETWSPSAFRMPIAPPEPSKWPKPEVVSFRCSDRQCVAMAVPFVYPSAKQEALLKDAIVNVALSERGADLWREAFGNNPGVTSEPPLTASVPVRQAPVSRYDRPGQTPKRGSEFNFTSPPYQMPR